MSRTVDERVVEMKFDNQNFERNVQTSMSTLDKLKSALKLDGITDGLEELDKRSRSMDLSPLGNAVDTVKSRFSALEVVAITALANITNSVVNTGKQMLNSLTIAPITQGFAEYELKMGSVKTMINSSGESLETVNKYLEELNHYADKTIYSFSDMTQNIGKFTNQGIKLHDAVNAIKGVSNAAAVSGANANEASRAMYNFSQALSAGYVKLIDWKSIENANMATVEFKQALLDTALAMGTVIEENGMYQTVTTNANGEVSDLFNSTMGFNDALAHQWMTTEVLSRTLANYGVDLKEMSKAEREAYLNQLKSIGYTDEQIAKIIEVNEKANESATQVKTFHQLMDTLAESVGSGWAQTFEILFGDLEEAIDLWTGVSTVVGGFIDQVSNARNELLELWASDELKGRAKLLEGISNIFWSLVNVVKPIRDAFREVFPPVTAQQLADLSEKFRLFSEKLIEFSEKQAPLIHDIFKGLFSVLKLVGTALSLIVKAIFPVTRYFIDLGGGVERGIASFARFITTISESSKTLLFLEEVAKRIGAVFEALAGWIYASILTINYSFLDGNIISGVVNLIIGEITNLIEVFVKLASAITGIDFSGFLNNVLGFLEHFRRMSVHATQAGVDFMKGFLVGLWEGLKSVISFVVNFGKKVIDSLKVALDEHSPSRSAKELAMLFVQGFIDGIVALTNITIEIIKGFGAAIVKGLDIAIRETPSAFKAVGDAFVKFWHLLGKVKDGVVSFFKTFSESGFSFRETIDTINKGLTGGLIIQLIRFLESIRKMISNSEDFFDGVIDILDGVKGALKAFQQDVKAKAIKEIATALAILVGSLLVLTIIPHDKLSSSITLLIGLAGGLLMMTQIISKMSGLSDVSSGKLLSISTSLAILATALGLLIVPIIVLGKIKMETLLQGLLGVVGTLGVFVLAIEEFNRVKIDSKKLIATSTSLMIFAAAIEMMVVPIIILGKIKMDTLLQGIIGLAGTMLIFMWALDRFNKIQINGKKIIAIASSLIVFAAAINMMVAPIVILGQFDFGTIVKGLVGIAGATAALLTAIYMFNKIEVDKSTLFAAAASLMIFAVAISMMVPPIIALGSMNLEALAKGIGGLLVSFGIMMTAISIFGEIGEQIDGKRMLAVGATLILFAAALNLLAIPIITLGLLPWKKMVIGLGLVTGGMVVLAGALIALTQLGAGGLGALAAGAAILEIALALNMLMVPLITMGSLPWPILVQGLKGFAIALGAIVAAGAVATLVVPGMIALTAVILAIGVSTRLIASSIEAASRAALAFAAALGMLSKITPEAAKGIGDNLKTILADIIMLIPNVVAAVGEGLYNIVMSIASKADDFAKAVIVIIKAILVVLGQTTADFVDVTLKLIKDILTSLDKFLPDIVQFLLNCLYYILDGIAKNIERIVTASINIAIGFWRAAISRIGEVIQVAIEYVVAFMNGLADGIDKNNEIVIEAFDRLLHSVFTALKQWFVYFVTGGGHFVTKIKDGIEQYGPVALKAMGQLVVNLVSSVWNAAKSMWNAGVNFIAGFVKGIVDSVNSVWDSAKNVGSEAVNAVTDFLDIHSPSKVMEKIGEFFTKGFTNGVDATSDTAYTSATGVGAKAMDGLKDATSSAADTGKGFVDNFLSKIDSMKGDAEKSATEFGDTTLKGLQSSTADKSYDLGKSFDQNFISGMSSLTGDVNQSGTSMGQSMLDSLSGLMSEGSTDIGSSFGTNFINGIGMGGSDVNAAGYDLGDLATTGLSDATTEDGFNIGEGFDMSFVDGLMSKDNEIAGAGANLSNIASENMSNVTFEPTIDYSKIESKPEEIKRKANDIGAYFITTFNNALQSNALRVYTTVDSITNNIVASMKNKLSSKEFFKIGNEIMVSISSGLNSGWLVKVYTIIEFIGKAIISLLNEALSEEKIKPIGTNVMMYIASGLNGGWMAKVYATIDIVTKAIISLFKEALSEAKVKPIGSNVSRGIAKGITENTPIIKKAAIDAARSALEGAKRALDEHSPSKEAAKIGKFFDFGLAEGITMFTDKVLGASEELGEKAVSQLSKSLSDLDDLTDEDLQYAPKITPVLDLTNVNSGIASMDNMLAANRSIALSSSLSSTYETNSSLNKLIDILSGNSSAEPVVDAINGLHNDISDMNRLMSSLRIVLDTGTLVGELAPGMDYELGQMVNFRERGMA